MKPASRKAKGRAAQQRVCDVLRSAFPELEPGDIESRGMGQSGADLIMSPAAQRLLGIAVECKATRGQPTMATFKQAKANTPEGHLPVVTWKPYGVGHDQMVVLLSLEDFAMLLRQARVGTGTIGCQHSGRVLRMAKVMGLDGPQRRPVWLCSKCGEWLADGDSLTGDGGPGYGNGNGDVGG